METLRRLLLVALAATPCLAQNDDFDAALQRAIVVDEMEHDTAKALEMYRAIARDENAPEAVRREAWLRLGRLLQRTGAEAKKVEAAFAAAGTTAAEQQDGWREEVRIRLDHLEQATSDLRVFQHTVAQLQWLGPEVAGPLLQRLQARLEADEHERAERLARAGWMLGGEGVARGFEQVLVEGDADARAAVGAGIAPNTATELVPLAVRFGDAPDAAAATVAAMVSIGPPVGGITLARAAGDERHDVRSAGLRQLRVWIGNADDARLRDPEWLATFVRSMRSALSSAHAETRRNAFSMLAKLWPLTPETRRLHLETLPGIAPDAGAMGNLVFSAPPRFPSTEAERELMLRTLRALGPAPDRAEARSGFAKEALLVFLTHSWGAEALPVVLEAMRLGYSLDIPRWLSEHAEPAAAATLMEAVGDDVARIDPATIAWMAHQLTLPPESWRVLARHVSGNATLNAIGSTGHPDAVRFILEGSFAYHIRAEALVYASARRDAEDTRAALRTLALRPAEEGWQTMFRNALLGRLAQVGDPGLAELFRPAAELGLREAIPESSGLALVAPAWAKDRQFQPPMWLLAASPEGTPWHGYAADEYARVLAAAIGAGAPFTFYVQNVDALPRATDTEGDAPSALGVVADAWVALLTDPEALPNVRVEPGLRWILEFEGDESLPDDVLARIRALREVVFESDLGSAHEVGLRTLPATWTERWSDEVWDLLVRSGEASRHAGQRLRESDQWDAARALRLAFESDMEWAPSWVLPQIDPRTDAAIDELVYRLCRHPEWSLRVTACRFLGRRLDPAAVPVLLDALRDPSLEVASAAREALEAIRFHQEQERYWARVFSGAPDVSAPSAAAALLDQAKPANDRDTRLLAIRSLAQLGAPETLPFLIRWTKDDDPEIADAARTAITRIHARSDEPK